MCHFGFPPTQVTEPHDVESEESEQKDEYQSEDFVKTECSSNVQFLAGDDVTDAVKRYVESFAVELQWLIGDFLFSSSHEYDRWIASRTKPNASGGMTVIPLSQRFHKINYAKISLKIWKIFLSQGLDEDDIHSILGVVLEYIRHIVNSRNRISWTTLFDMFGVPAVVYCFAYLANVCVMDAPCNLTDWCTTIQTTGPHHHMTHSLHHPHQMIKCEKNVLKLRGYSLSVSPSAVCRWRNVLQYRIPRNNAIKTCVHGLADSFIDDANQVPD